ncbi:MAG: hypothetical protein KDD82_22105, partial [Planctomycetes bacterium]|nr:hypothetical protein [Planctomycetota bacterium]
MPRAAQFLPPLLLVLLASVTHLPALRGGEFTLDDVALIEENPRLEVHSGADLWRLVSGRYWGDDAGGERLWRPVPLVTYAAERRAHGGDPYLSRALNVALHTGCAWLIYALLAGWLPRRASLLASVAFLLHPVHAEVTGGVVGRAELLALGGVLSAVWLHRRLRRARSGWARAGYAVLAALAFGV